MRNFEQTGLKIAEKRIEKGIRVTEADAFYFCNVSMLNYAIAFTAFDRREIFLETVFLW